MPVRCGHSPFTHGQHPELLINQPIDHVIAPWIEPWTVHCEDMDPRPYGAVLKLGQLSSPTHDLSWTLIIAVVMATCACRDTTCIYSGNIINVNSHSFLEYFPCKLLLYAPTISFHYQCKFIPWNFCSLFQSLNNL